MSVYIDGRLATNEELLAFEKFIGFTPLFMPLSDESYDDLMMAYVNSPELRYLREPLPIIPEYVECLFLRHHTAMEIAHTLGNNLYKVIEEVDRLCAKHKRGVPEETLTLRTIIWENLQVAKGKKDTESVRKNVETLLKINKEVEEIKGKLVGNPNIFTVDFKGVVRPK